MKKFLALTLALVMLLSVASLAAAVEFSHSMGGRFYDYFSTIDGDRGFNPAPGNDTWDTILEGKVTEGNTWASFGFIFDTWNNTIKASFGIDNIADTPWSLGFSTHDTGTANLGQQFMGDLFNDFKADPVFNTCDMGGSFNVKYITDTFEFRAEAQVYDGDGSTGWNYEKASDNITWTEQTDEIKEGYALGFILKGDIGKFYIGGKTRPQWDDPLYILGADLKLNDTVGLKVDFWSDKSGVAGMGDVGVVAGGGHQTLQATVDIDRFTGQLAYTMHEEDVDDTIGVGAAYKLTDKLTVGAKYFMVDDEKLYEDGLYDVYALYKVGVWDIKVGASNAQFLRGQGGNNNEGAEVDAPHQTILNDDGFFYIGVHFEF